MTSETPEAERKTMPNKPYKFHELKRSQVPEDANAPVEKMLAEELGSKIAAEVLRSHRRGKVCGGVQVFDLVYPKLISVKTNFGMVEGSDLIKERDEYIDGVKRFHIVSLIHRKNENMDFKGEKKNG
jgi:hypothetical protein